MNQQILVIDDSEKVHPLIKAILAEEPVDIHSATDPKYGMVLASSLRPDLILLDVDMPGLDGFEVCKRLKADPETAKCPVIFLTAHSSVGEKVRGFNLGAVDYVTKPCNRGELTARVQASLQTHRVIRDLEEKSLIDSLTGLGNRAMFAKRMEAEICLRVRAVHPLSVILLDVDRFKQINTTYGRLIGDELLQKIAKIIIHLGRTEDVPCRVGGDKFSILAPHTTGADAVVFAGRIRESLLGTEIEPHKALSPLFDDAKIQLTASFGVAEAGGPYDRSMLRRANEAMRRAKQQGRNRVLMAAPAETAAA